MWAGFIWPHAINDSSLCDHRSGESLDSSSSLGSSSGDSSLALLYASSEFEGADEPEEHPFLYEPVTSSDDDEGNITLHPGFA